MACPTGRDIKKSLQIYKCSFPLDYWDTVRVSCIAHFRFLFTNVQIQIEPHRSMGTQSFT